MKSTASTVLGGVYGSTHLEGKPQGKRRERDLAKGPARWFVVVVEPSKIAAPAELCSGGHVTGH